MKQNKFLSITMCVIITALMSYSANAQIIIAANGKSAFTIVVPNKAPSSVQAAAKEMQKDIKLATGAKLDIKKDNTLDKSSYISLGLTEQAKAAEFSTKNMAYGQARTVTKDGNLYIFGIDTPDGKWTKLGGVSNGTANGVYSFLENYLNVRWLMPGKLGRDVPRLNTFSINHIDSSKTPDFDYRHFGHLSDYANHTQYKTIRRWMAHLRVGKGSYSRNVNASQSMWKVINKGFGGKWNRDMNSAALKKAYKEHRDWFAMDSSGKRPFPKNKYSKLEITNQDLVKWYAKQAIKTLKESKRPGTYSLSLSDGQGWSQSSQSKALFDPPPPGKDVPGKSSLVLTWYHDIAEIVAKQYPEGKLAGNLYSSFKEPPTKVDMKLPDNFTPMLVTNAGYSLYRQDRREYVAHLLSGWEKVAPKYWYYYDIPSLLLRQYKPEIEVRDNFPGTTGIVTPAAPGNLNFTFAQLIKNHFKGVYLYGSPAWSNAALTNYIVAKLSWNPHLDALKLRNDWLERAYGEQAGKAMEVFYDKLNEWFKEYSQNSSYILRYQLRRDSLKKIYAKHYPEMEKLFLRAAAKPMTHKQKERLNLIKNNIIVLQWRLRNARLLSSNFSSPLQYDSGKVNAIMSKTNEAFPLFPGAAGKVKKSAPKPYPWKVRFNNRPARTTSSKSTFKGLGDSSFLIFAKDDGDIQINTKQVTQGLYFAGYQLRNQDGKLISKGIFNTQTPIIIHAKAGKYYVLSATMRKPVNFELQVEHAKIAHGKYDNKLLTLQGKKAPVYVYAPNHGNLIGVIEEGSSVVIQKPFSGSFGLERMQRSSNYKNAHVLKSLDSGWVFNSDPKDNGLERGITKLDFDDSSWAPISVLNWWQHQGLGFDNYHGVGWYRNTFTVAPLKKGERARLYFNAVDGNAAIYLNGKKIATHEVGPPPKFKGWNKTFSTSIARYLKPGKNILAVKVTSKNDTTSSGIFKGVAIVAAQKPEK